MLELFQMKTKEFVSTNYIPHPFGYNRFETRLVKVGDINIGATEPIVLQSMTTSDTMDTQAVVTESIEMFNAGSSLVRITAPGTKEAQNLQKIKRGIEMQGLDIPLIADIHFTPKAAMTALEYVEKVRINPGNFCDTKKFKYKEYSDEEYNNELDRIRTVFLPLVSRAKQLNKALRIGSNHGSLSDRILNRYGDTPLGMVESAMEYLRIACDEKFYNIIVSMKASNPQVMIQAYRLLVRTLKQENMNFPLHLGVTEAGYGRDGRIKSAVGIGALLLDGLGDTIRVSLTEDAVHELPPARQIARLQLNPFIGHANSGSVNELETNFLESVNPYQYQRFKTELNTFGGWKIGKKSPVGLIISLTQEELYSAEIQESLKEHFSENIQALRTTLAPELSSELTGMLEKFEIPVFVTINNKFPKSEWKKLFNETIENIYPVISVTDDNLDWIDFELMEKSNSPHVWIEINQTDQKTNQELNLSSYYNIINIVLEKIKNTNIQPIMSIHQNNIQVQLNRLMLSQLKREFPVKIPAIVLHAVGKTEADLLYRASAHCGSLFLDGIGDALYIENQNMTIEDRIGYGLDLLQATRLRLSKTEFISCPSCGRTIFDLQETTSMIKERTGHLKGVKIAVMGCIVNGPGEMADADFGYVGAGPDKIHLYREKELVKSNISSSGAVEELINLIKEHDMWQEPDPKV